MASTAKLNPRLKAQLDRTPQIAVQAAREAMEKGADEIVALMKASAPRRYGDLIDSIAWTWGDAPDGALIVDEVRTGPRQGLQYTTLRLTIYVGVWYAHFPEFGTAPHAQPKRGTDHPGTSAQPYFFPSWRAKKAAFRRKIRAAVRRAIKEAING